MRRGSLPNNRRLRSTRALIGAVMLAWALSPTVAGLSAQVVPTETLETAKALSHQLMRRLDWNLIAIAIVVPTAAGLLVASCAWGKNDSTVGSAVASGAVMLAVLVIFGREYVAFERLQEACRAAHMACLTFRFAFAHYFTIGMLAFVDVAIVFYIGLRRDEWRRSRAFSRGAASTVNIS